MKTIIVLSDTHGNLTKLEEMKNLLSEADMIFHLGDTVSDALYLKRTFGDKVYVVQGNCDGCYGLDEKIIEVEGKKILLTHGHYFGVKNGYLDLEYHAKEKGVDAVFFGHTHFAEVIDGYPIMMNPGTLSRSSYKMSYGYCVVAGGKIVCKIVEM